MLHLVHPCTWVFMAVTRRSALPHSAGGRPRLARSRGEAAQASWATSHETGSARSELAHAGPQARTHAGGVVCSLGGGAGCRTRSGSGARARRHGGVCRGMRPRAAHAGRGLVCPLLVLGSAPAARVRFVRSPTLGSLDPLFFILSPPSFHKTMSVPGDRDGTRNGPFASGFDRPSPSWGVTVTGDSQIPNEDPTPVSFRE